MPTLTVSTDRLDTLRQTLREWDRLVVAFSGGVDSSLLLKVAVDELGERAVAIMATSASLPAREKVDAQALAAEIGTPLVCIDTQETADPAYQSNAPNRCFHCKDHVYSALLGWAKHNAPGAILIDGMNADDTLDIRPGRAAALRHGVRSPLHDLGFTKDDVRNTARELNLRVWDKPAAACLASRIAYGTPVTDPLLGRIERAEDYLLSLGFSEVRVRHHGDLARLEFCPEELPLALEQSAAIEGGLRRLSWLYVTVDLAGLQHGSMNRGLKATS